MVWEYSIAGEVFALNNAICACIVYVSIRLLEIDIHRKENERIHLIYSLLALGSLFGGLALANQHSSLLLLVFVIPMLWKRFYKLMTMSVVLKLMLSGFCGLLPYVYIYFAAIEPKQGSWGRTSNLSGWLKHVLRAEYGRWFNIAEVFIHLL